MTALANVRLKNGVLVPYAAGLAVVQRLRDLQTETPCAFAEIVTICREHQARPSKLTAELVEILRLQNWLDAKSKKDVVLPHRIASIITCAVEDGQIVNPFWFPGDESESVPQFVKRRRCRISPERAQKKHIR